MKHSSATLLYRITTAVDLVSGGAVVQGGGAEPCAGANDQAGLTS